MHFFLHFNGNSFRKSRNFGVTLNEFRISVLNYRSNCWYKRCRQTTAERNVVSFYWDRQNTPLDFWGKVVLVTTDGTVGFVSRQNPMKFTPLPSRAWWNWVWYLIRPNIRWTSLLEGWTEIVETQDYSSIAPNFLPYKSSTLSAESALTLAVSRFSK